MSRSALVAVPPIPAPPTEAAPVCRTALSIDVEEYFHGEVFAGRIARSEWGRMERRVRPCLEWLGEQLAATANRATFFVLADTLDEVGGVLRDLARDGHEIACHGAAHEHLARLTPALLRDDLRRAMDRIRECVGVRPRGYRAPTFSLTRATAWALDVLLEAGFDYDASVFPIHHDRYGVPDAPTEPFRIVAAGGATLVEFPPLTVRLGPLRLPFGGGGYFRLWPYAVFRRVLAARVRAGQPALLYLHPWELDPDQPRLPAGWLAGRRHRLNLRHTRPRLLRLLREFRFDTAAAVLARVRAERPLPEFRLTART